MSDASELIAQQILNGSINKKNFGNILYNVYVYGAKGDGVNDDTQAVQDAIDLAVFNGGSLVYFPPGTYKVTALTNTSMINFVGDTASFVGYSGIIYQFSTNNGTINVKDQGASGDGVTDNSQSIQNIVTNIGSNGGQATFPPGDYKFSSNVNLGSSVVLDFMKGADLLFNSGISMTPGPLTNLNGDFGHSVRNTGNSGFDIYNSIFPNVTQYDGFQSVTEIIDGSNIENASGVAGYVKNMSTGTNGVALMGVAYAGVNSSKVWGINTLLQDSDTRVAGAKTGIYLSNELDFNVMNPNTQVIGLSIGGNSLAQPTNANGFIVNTLSQTLGYKWNAGFMSNDYAADNALFVGLSTTGNNAPSQKILFGSTNGSGTKVSNILRSEAGGYVTLGSTGFNAFKIYAGNLVLDSSQGVVVNGNTIITDRQTAVANATNATDVITQLNALLVRLRTHGLIAP